MLQAIAVLYIEELKATMRGRFTWLGASVIYISLFPMMLVFVHHAFH